VRDIISINIIYYQKFKLSRVRFFKMDNELDNAVMLDIYVHLKYEYMQIFNYIIVLNRCYYE